MTRALDCASIRTVHAPIPRDPPVTSTTLSARSICIAIMCVPLHVEAAQAPIMSSRPFEQAQRADGHDGQQTRDGENRWVDFLANALPHLARQRVLLDTGEEERHHHFVERGDE